MSGNKPTKKIALIGSAPSSIRLAPYHDPSWEIWGCSPGVYGVAPRSNVWFELHRYEPGQTWFSPEYCQFLAKHPCVFTAEVRPEIANSRVMPVDMLVAKYGPYFFTSSLSWMFALAIEAGATSIGLWGVDMAANEEYGDQRAGCHYFGQIAAALGIEVGVAPESDLFRPRPLYGVSEIEHGQIKSLARKRELQGRLQMLEQQKRNVELEEFFLKGAIDNETYHANTWMAQEVFLSPPKLEIVTKTLHSNLDPVDLPQIIEPEPTAASPDEPHRKIKTKSAPIAWKG